ncbi:MAG TPA: hypothetical protein VKT77_15195 [Chthonomonadaceae bacterium]|nr:hypothetical protein [Chthonomonadaceae bacterium]
MALEIGRYGIVQRHDGGAVTICRPAGNGGPATEIEVPEALADAHRLATGDIAACKTEPIALPDVESHPEPDEEGAEAHVAASPTDLSARHHPPLHGPLGTHSPAYPITSPPAHPTAPSPAERATHITAINGLPIEEAADRPFPRTKRSRSERVPPDRPLLLATGPDDYVGRTLDLCAPLGAGVFGAIYGPHGAGLTRTLQSVLGGVAQSAPDCVVIVLLLRARAEEATEWRRRVPEADVIVGAGAFAEAPPAETLRLCSLVLEAAQRQTELGRDVVLLVDSLTAHWAAMLEAEEADAQQEADSAAARQGIRELAQRAGCFHGQAPLGGGLGGTLTVLGTIWHQAVDEEAEWERDTHPHLRLLEHLLPDCGWLVPLSGALKRRRLYPAIDVKECRSEHESRLLPDAIRERLLRVRGALPRHDPVAAHLRVMEALDASADLPGLLDRLDALNEPEEDKPDAALDRVRRLLTFGAEPTEQSAEERPVEPGPVPADRADTETAAARAFFGNRT